jgi:hypothetical protein
MLSQLLNEQWASLFQYLGLIVSYRALWRSSYEGMNLKWASKDNIAEGKTFSVTLTTWGGVSDSEIWMQDSRSKDLNTIGRPRYRILHPFPKYCHQLVQTIFWKQRECCVWATQKLTFMCMGVECISLHDEFSEDFQSCESRFVKEKPYHFVWNWFSRLSLTSAFPADLLVHYTSRCSNLNLNYL